MRVRALTDFFDIEKQVDRKKDDEFEVAEARAKKLMMLKIVEKAKPTEKTEK